MTEAENIDVSVCSNDLLSAISAIRIQLDAMERQIRRIDGMPTKSLTLNNWLNLHEYPRSVDLRWKLGKADEQLQAGYSYDEIVRIFRWHNKRSFLPVLKRFCDERGNKQ